MRGMGNRGKKYTVRVVSFPSAKHIASAYSLSIPPGMVCAQLKRGSIFSPLKGNPLLCRRSSCIPSWHVLALVRGGPTFVLPALPHEDFLPDLLVT